MPSASSWSVMSGMPPWWRLPEQLALLLVVAALRDLLERAPLPRQAHVLDQVRGGVAALSEDGAHAIPVADDVARSAQPADHAPHAAAGRDLEVGQLERAAAAVVAGLLDQVLRLRRPAPGARTERRLRDSGHTRLASTMPRAAAADRLRTGGGSKRGETGIPDTRPSIKTIRSVGRPVCSGGSADGSTRHVLLPGGPWWGPSPRVALLFG